MAKSIVTTNSTSLASSDTRHCFSSLAKRLQNLLSSQGVLVDAFESPELMHFSDLRLNEQVATCKQLAQYISICENTIEMVGDRLSMFNRTMAWVALRELGLVPSADLFTKIRESDVVEFYNLENIQIFRNFNFFGVCSYTIEDLYTRKWSDLFSRDEEGVTQQISTAVTNLVLENRRQIRRTEIGKQTIREMRSSRHYVLQADVHHLGLLMDRHDRPGAIVAVESAKLIQSGIAPTPQSQTVRFADLRSH